MNTPHTARIAHDQALEKVMQTLLKDDTEVYKQFVENESFQALRHRHGLQANKHPINRPASAKVVAFHLLKGPEGEDHTLYASHTVWEIVPCLKRGPNQRRSEPRIVGQGTTNRCIWIIRSSRGSRCVRR